MTPILALLLGSILSATSSAADYVQIAALFRTGKYAECAEEAGKAIAADEFNENCRLVKIRSEMAQGKYADALATLDAALQKLSTSIHLRWLGRDVCRFNGQLDRARKLDDEIGQLVRQAPGRYSDAVNRVVVGRFLLNQTIDPKRVLDGIYNEVKKQQPNLAMVWLASGDLALEKQDYALAAQNYAQAAKLDPSDPDVHYGLARAFAPSESAKATTELQAALALNPNHVESLLVAVEDQIDSERYDDADKVLKAIAAVNPHHPRAAACRAVLAHLRNQPDVEKREREAAQEFWSANPEPLYVIGKKLSQKYRFREGAQYQRDALALAADYLPAKTQLAQDLLRLGQEVEGWQLAGEVLEADEYSILAHNLTTLHECLDKFRTIEADGFVLRMDAREADVYGGRVINLLSRAKAALCAKYDMRLEKPVIVEMFPRQQDFAIRTFGMPGGAGFLGVCFGTVITANSPASQGAHPTCWEATLWHEFCHVVTLNKTHNRMPRWLSEGISVYEERQADPTWGQSIKPAYRKMLLGDDLVPVSRLSGAFLNPPSPQHLQFAYFESSLVVEYLVETHGLDTMKKILVDLGAGVTINDALSRHTVPIEQLDASFADYARAQAKAMAPEVDWSEPELPRRADEKLLTVYLKEHPQNYSALQRLAGQRIAAKNWAGAKEPLAELRRLYPRDAAADGLYALLARVHRELKETDQERKVLMILASLSDDNVEALTRLTELTAAAGDWELTKTYAQKWLAISPLLPEPHRRCAQAAEKLHDDPLAIESYRSLLHLDSVGAADLHLQLATALERSGDLPAARRHALLALEETPRFRAAHKRLLEITRKLEAAPPGKDPAAPTGTGERGKKKLEGF
ncbi:MAG: tetratricopeptide repeat protein [Planctomycetia bacterium]|nr:tetratricopeptide repeat protein [Planctomycetia bacterium]